MTVNKAILVGRLGKDPEIRVTGAGLTVAAFSLATDFMSKKGGQAVKETEWHRIVVFDRLAELCRDYLSKGRLIYVEGRLKTRQWEDKNGDRRSTTEIIVEKIDFLGRDVGESPSSRNEGGDTGPDTNNFDINDDDVPF